jgi:hypothetical protein
MSFEIKEIKIKFYTNLKNKDMRLIDFNLDMLYNETKGQAGSAQADGKKPPSVVELNKSGLNSLPYFTMSVRYPLDRLQKDLLTYQERVDFFFDEKKFERLLFLYTKTPKESTDPDENNDIAEHNVMVMLEILFPTKFTVINNAHTSLDHVVGNSSLKRMIINPTIKKYFSYLKLADGKIYTFTRLIWLNDLMNHPLYRTFINEFHTFSLWYSKEDEKIKKQLNATVTDLSKLVDSILENIYRGIKQSFTYYDVQPKYDEKAFDLNKKPVERLVTTVMRFKFLLDKLKRSRVIETDELFKNAGFQIDNDNDKYFMEALKGAIDKTTKEEDEKEEIERKVKKAENTGLEKSEYEDLDDVYKKISDYIERHFTSDSIKEIMIVRFINELTTANTKKSEKTQKTPERVIPLLKSIEDSLKSITMNPMKLDVDRFEKLRLYITMPMSVVEDKLRTSGLSPEYATFIRNVRSRYYGTQRKSINTYLQNLIDCADEKSVHDFFEIFGILYNKYLRGETKKNSFELETQIQKALNTSISKVNTNVANWQYEIYVMADFIQGKVDDENSNKIFCPYVGEYLGVMFEFLFQMALYGKSSKKDLYRWAVDRNRVYFSIETMILKNGEVKQQLEQKPLNVSVVGKNGNKFSSDVIYNAENDVSMPKTTVSPQDEDRINSLFVQNIISSDNKIVGDNGVLTQLRKYLADIDESRLLSYISQNNKELYDVILKWTENEYTRKEALLEKMIALKPTYDSKLAVINKRLNDPQIVLDINERIRLKTDFELNTLYSIVLEKLIDLEQKKALDTEAPGLTKLSSTFGGTRRYKKRRRVNKFTRKLSA